MEETFSSPNTYYLSYLAAPLQSAICQYEIFDIFHVILRGCRFRGTATGLIKNRRATTSTNQFLTITIEEEELPYSESKRSLISVSYFSCKATNQTTDRYFSFSFFKYPPPSTCDQNKTSDPIRHRCRECTRRKQIS